MRSAAEAANGACSASAPASSSVALLIVGSPQKSEFAGYIDTDGAWLIGRYARNGRLLPREYRVVDRQRRPFIGQVGGAKVRRPLARNNARFQAVRPPRFRQIQGQALDRHLLPHQRPSACQ